MGVDAGISSLGTASESITSSGVRDCNAAGSREKCWDAGDPTATGSVEWGT